MDWPRKMLQLGLLNVRLLTLAVGRVLTCFLLLYVYYFLF